MALPLKPPNKSRFQLQVMRLEHFLAVPIAWCIARTYAVYELVNRIHNRAIATSQLREEH
jgi:hypothetical protein